jgi:hypothetical protein
MTSTNVFIYCMKSITTNSQHQKDMALNLQCPYQLHAKIQDANGMGADSGK